MKSPAKTTITFVVSHDEKRILHEKARRLGLGLSAYLRAHAYIANSKDAVSAALPSHNQTDLEDSANAQENTQPTA